MGWPTRRTPVFALMGSLLSIVLGLIISQRQTKTAERIGSELGTVVGTRWKEGDQRDTAMLVHASVVRRLTVIVVVCTIISTVCVVYASLK